MEARETSGAAGPGFSEAVERLLEEGRHSPPQRPTARRVAAELAVGWAFLATALILATSGSSGRSFSAGVAVTLVIAYALASRVQFDVGPGYTAPTQLFFVPMLFALPPATAPLLVAAGLLLADLPDYLRGRTHPLRAVHVLGDSWHAVGPAVILTVAGTSSPDPSGWPLYAGALAAQVLTDLVASTVREWLGRGVAPRIQTGVLGWVYAVDVLLAPIGLLAAFASENHDYAFLLLLPLPALFLVFAHERRARIQNALDLSDAYRERSELSDRLLETERTARRSREELIAAASHEMQTPLAVLLGLIDSFEGPQPGRPGETSRRMRRQAILLRHLVRQFVDYTRLKTGRKLELARKPTLVGPVLEEIVGVHGGPARVALTCAEDLPPALVDGDRLHQIVMNLVSNAVKHSPGSEPVRILARAEGDRIEIAVVDRGPGIDSARLPGLFDELGGARSANGAPGTGLGLYVSAILAEQQESRIEVESEPGQGSRFALLVPRA